VRITELEESCNTHTKQQSAHKARISELEIEVESLRSADDSHVRKHTAMKKNIEELEESLMEKETLAQQQLAHKRRIIELEGEVASLRTADESNVRKHHTMKEKIADLEESLRQKDAKVVEAGGHTRQINQLNARIEDIERELFDANSKCRDLEKQLRETTLSLHEAQSTQTTHSDSSQRITNMLKEIASAREALAASRDDVDAARRAAEDAQRNAEYAIQAQESLHAKQIRDSEETASRLSRERSELLLKISSLELRLKETVERGDKSLVRKSTLESNGTFSFGRDRMSTSVRKSLAGDILLRSHLWGELLPGNGEEFVVKVRAATKNAADAVQSADEVHGKCIDRQLDMLVEHRSHGSNISLFAAVSSCTLPAELEVERKNVAELVEAAVHELKALLLELETHHEISKTDTDAIYQRIDADLQTCLQSLGLLLATSALSDVPEEVLVSLVEFSSNPKTVWRNTFSPMHWAAQHGRKDIASYLLEKSDGGGDALLRARDHYSNTPLYYAQLGKQSAFEMWLKNEIQVDEPLHIEDKTPKFDDLPAAYKQVLVNIHKVGWRGMKWKEGFTMLHWATKKGKLDLCEYLVQLDADPSASDSSGATPISMAAGNDELLSLLKELQKKRRASVGGRR